MNVVENAIRITRKRFTGVPTAADVLAEEVEQLQSEIEQLQSERLLLANLAAGTPQFFNPLEAMAAETLRDTILAEAADASVGQPPRGHGGRSYRALDSRRSRLGKRNKR
jgi:hypothetical protein